MSIAATAIVCLLVALSDYRFSDLYRYPNKPSNTAGDLRTVIGR